jgi:hypothetical protein
LGGAAHYALQAAKERFARKIGFASDSTFDRERFEIAPV